MKLLKLTILWALLCCGTQVNAQPFKLDSQTLKQPPQSAQCRVWWRWLNGNASREGITRDLESMQTQGIQGVTLFSINGPYPEGDALFMTDTWQELVSHALAECERLYLDFSFHQCDGWGASGGPWVTPEMAMKKVTYRKTTVEGGKHLKLDIKQPYAVQDYYRDIAVLAYPSIDTVAHPFTPDNVRITNNHWAVDLNTYIDGEIYSEEQIGIYRNHEKSNFIQLELIKPFPVAGLSLYLAHHETPIAPTAGNILYANDTTNFKHLKSFTIDGLGAYITFPETKAKYFRIVFTEFSERAYKQGRMYLSEIELLPKGTISNIPKINDFEIKSGMWHRRRDILPAQDVPANWIIPKDQIIDITDKMTADGQIDWQAPEGHWTIARIGYTITGKQNGPATKLGVGLECDKLDTAAVNHFFNGFVKLILDQESKHKNKTITRVFADSFEAIGQNWTKHFRAAFKRKRGYEMAENLLIMTGEVVESVDYSERFLHDVRATISDLMAENYYRQMTTLCHREGLEYCAQTAGEQQLMINPVYYAKQVDHPATEFWVNHTDSGSFLRYNGSVVDLISAAHLYGKPVIPTEAFTCLIGDYRTTPQLLKAIGDRAFCLGINQFEMHTYIHQPHEKKPGWQHFPYGIAFTRHITWWDYSKAWLNYLSRCQYLLQQGQPVADILVFTGDKLPASLEMTYDAEDPYELIPTGYSMDACSRDALLNDITFKNKALTAPSGTSYKLLIIPDTDVMSLDVLQKLEQFIEKGAVLYGPRPTRSPGLNDDDQAIKTLADKIWGNCDGQQATTHQYGKGRVIWGIPLQEALKNHVVEPDFTCQQDGILYHHRQSNGEHVYFISNQNDKAVNIKPAFRVQALQANLFNPQTGDIKTIKTTSKDEEGQELALHLPAYGSVFVIFSDKDISDKKEQITDKQELVETISLTEAWTISFPEGWGAPKQISVEALTGWDKHPDDGVKYFSGTATYSQTVRLKKKQIKNHQIELQLPQVHNMAEVLVNDQVADTLWTAPYCTDVSNLLQAGENKIEIRVSNTWANRLIGDQYLPEDERYTWMPCFGYNFDKPGHCKTFYHKGDPLPPSGLIGTVLLKCFKTK